MTTPVARIALGIEYDGTGYHGWQTQLGVDSVQQQVETALGRVADAPIAVVAAGRTDTGVHATAQVVHFESAALRPVSAWVTGTNNYLPTDISVRWSAVVPSHFHARYSAESRSYRYWILNRRTRSGLAARRAWLIHRQLDVAAMQAAGDYLVGEHDFSGYRAAECQAKSPIRRLHELAVRRSGEWVSIDVRANAFLHHMVRNIVGLLVVVGRGDAPPRRAREQLESRHRPGGEATAAACGLYLTAVAYPPAFALPMQSGADDSAMIAPLSSP